MAQEAGPPAPGPSGPLLRPGGPDGFHDSRFYVAWPHGGW